MKSTTKKPAKRGFNVRLLRRIQKHILEEPRRFFMLGFIAKGEPGGKFKAHPNVPWFRPADLADSVPPCGTAACIAGWTNLFTGHRPDAWHPARKEIGISNAQAKTLFNSGFWPEPFRGRYSSASTPAKRAKIAAARIEHLIQHGE